MQRPRNKAEAMRWVAAKERKRIEQANAEPVFDRRRVPVPRKHKPDFIIRIEDRFGERVQITVNRYYNRVLISNGQSARQLCRGIEQLITKSA
jgi:hypothetical protein